MSNIPRMAAYAKAFEDAFDSDEWGEVGSFLTDDVVYEIGLPLLGKARTEGREETLAWFAEVLDRFDRRFDEKRELVLLEGPSEQGDEVRFRGSAIYRAAGAPDFHLELEEVLRFRGDRIDRIEDRYSSDMTESLGAYLEAHGERLGIEWLPEAVD